MKTRRLPLAQRWSRVATTWLPFGGGNRRCLGATFAMTEMRVVLRQILLDVELETTTARDERQHVRHVILSPSRGARIRVRAHRQLSASNSLSASSSTVTARDGSEGKVGTTSPRCSERPSYP